jgi:phosphoglycerate dehydrogenase-like enzyme
VVGFGRIGQRVAELCYHGFAMPILYYDAIDYPGVASALGARRVPLNELFRTSDFISVHVPLSPATRGLIDEAKLRSMKQSAYLINTSRGPVVDQVALVKALQEGWIVGEGLDVYDPEPMLMDHPLYKLDNVVMSPHMAAHTDEAMLRMAMVLSDILAVIQGRQPQNPVPWAGGQ